MHSRAESLGQVYLFAVSWLYQFLQNVPQKEWDRVFLSYDNMCQLNRLRASKLPLPLDPPFDSMWNRIQKIIDGLHVRNHKDPACQKMYDHSQFEKAHPTAQKNTMAAEQTFSWLVRFKKQLNSMPKMNQMFFLHRLHVHRNRYISEMVLAKQKVIGGSVRDYCNRQS